MKLRKLMTNTASLAGDTATARVSRFARALSRASIGAALVASIVQPAAAAGTVVYSNDFSTSAGSEWSNRTIATSNGERFLGASAYGFGNGTDTLTLTGLAPHSSVTLNFDFYAIESWDGNGPNGGGIDNFRVDQNGSNILLTNFANFRYGNTQAFSLATPNGLGFANPPRSGAFDNGHLGYGVADFGDSTYRLSLTFASSSPTLALAFTSLQNQPPGDEGWGLDNVRVSISPVPEPSSWALMCGGLGLMGLALRRGRGRSRSSLAASMPRY